MVTSIEVFDPRLGTWTTGEPLNHARGYSGAVVLKESIYMIGGLKVGEQVVDTVSKYINTNLLPVMILLELASSLYFITCL